MTSRKSFPKRVWRYEVRKRPFCVSKVGRNGLVESSLWGRERGRALGLLHGQKSRFHQVPKGSASCHSSIIWTCTALGIPLATLNLRGAIHSEQTEFMPCGSWKASKAETQRKRQERKSGSQAAAGQRPQFTLNSWVLAPNMISGGLGLQRLEVGFQIPSQRLKSGCGSESTES